jgi:lysophospholipase L1-like esterase
MSLKVLYIIIFFLAAVLCISLTATYRIFRNLYTSELKLRLDPINEGKAIELRSVKFLLLGDSRILQWNIPDSVISSEMILNYGIDSQTSEQVLNRARNYFNKYTAQYVLIQVGINDIKVIGLLPEQKSKIITNTTSNLKLLLNVCVENHSIPIFISILPTGPLELKRRFFWNNKIEEARTVVNCELIGFCKEKKICYLDFDSLVSSENKIIINTYYKDCLHLNEKGYKKINEWLRKYLREIELEK